MQAPVRPTCRLAAASVASATLEFLWFGLAVMPSGRGIGVLGVLIALVFSPPIAIVCGHLARARIRRSAGTMDGDHLAVIGLCLGYMALVCVVVFLAYLGIMVALFSNGTWKG